MVGVDGEPLIAALDVGSSAVKAALVDAAGRVRARGEAPLDTTTGPGGQVEQDARQWWHAARLALSACEGRDGVVVLAVTGQMQDLVCVDADDAVGPALLYSDTRAVEQHVRLVDAVAGWERRTGNHQDPSNVAAKIRWTAEHRPDVWARTTTVLLGAAGYVLWRAGGEATCDVVTASATGLLDVERRGWAQDVLDLVGVRLEQLPRLVDGGADAVVGRLDDAGARHLGLPAGTPLVAAMGDAGATSHGLVGSGPSSAYAYLGTTGWFARVVPAPTEPPAPSPLHSLVLPGWDRRLRIGAVLSAGAAAAWALSTHLPGTTFAGADARVLARLDAGPPEPLLCLPSLAGERTPVREATARGVVVGMTPGTTAVDLYLAVLTGVAMNLRHAADAMAATGDGSAAADTLPLVGGGARSPAWRRVTASVFGVPVVTVAGGEPGLTSAVITAADAIGLPHTIRPLFDGPPDQVTDPGPEADLLASLLPAHRGLYDALGPAFGALSSPPAGADRTATTHRTP